MKLQKLCYLAEAYYWAIYDNPLTGEPFEAWAHGPVSQTIWKHYKKYKWNPIIENEKFDVSSFKDDVVKYLKEIVDVFFGFNAYQLERIVHADTAWQKARGTLAPEEGCNTIIDTKDMAKYYKKFIK